MNAIKLFDLEHKRIDFEKLAHGVVIPAETIEDVFGIDRSDPRFAFLLLGCREQIKTDGRFMCKVENQALRVLDPDEAADYGPRLMKSDLHRHKKNLDWTMSAIDLESLSTDEQRRLLTQEIETHSRIALHHAKALKGLNEATRKLKKPDEDDEGQEKIA